MVNPYLNNHQRAAILGRAIFGPHWIMATCGVLGVDSGVLRYRHRDLQDGEICKLLDAARRHIKDLEIAIEQTKLPPFIV